MEKDFKPSKHYSKDQLDCLEVPYKFRDYCQDDYADYLYCKRLYPKIIENKIVYTLPFSQHYTNCKYSREKWEQCEQYREKEIFQEMRKIFVQQTKKIN